ncbi:lipopolysaccharide-induced tumor necrosis factor-alpha factor homolog [Drosophila biarmipes]|uniref:lipopolysaccharide-induced tumor necrosis factor-alpha factor homolog n=1 Tax=Drosophila biarmipes TaxID=125945 RepID=UPI001CDAC207|nr:lipopolysaccharide-induced tumor necrosis factor-alpha factor homolog [Drosophila biarmipes]
MLPFMPIVAAPAPAAPAPTASAPPTFKYIPVVGPRACTVVCPNCNQQVTTRVTYQSTTRTHMIALILCCLSCLPCAVCLYCTPCARNCDHHCPACKVLIATYER